MSQTFRYYTMLRPLRDCVDDGALDLARVPVEDNGRVIEIALIGTPGEALAIRVSVSSLDGEPSIEERLRFDDLTEAMLGLVRIHHDPGLAFAESKFRYGCHTLDGESLHVDLGLQGSKPTFNLDIELFTAYMGSDKILQDILRLYADAQHPYTPVQYRYLSAFKIIEHEFKRNRHKWKPELDVLLASFEAQYRSLNAAESLHDRSPG